MTAREFPTRYLDGEGRARMVECMTTAFDWSATHGVTKLVIFTGSGEGPMHAVESLLPLERFSAFKLIAVTPPVGRPYKTDPRNTQSELVRAGITPAMRELLSEFGVPVIAAQLPFKEVHIGGNVRSSEWTRVAEAYGVLGGGFALCIQAVLMACDAGEVDSGERVVVMTSDTAISCLASRTETFLSPVEGLVVEHIVCRPRRFDISKPHHRLVGVVEPHPQTEMVLPVRQPALPAADHDDDDDE